MTTWTKAEMQHREWVRSLGCLVSGEWNPTIHHVTGYADRMGRFTRSNRLIVPLAARFHQKVHDPCANDPISVEGLSHRGFYEKHGIDLFAEALRLEEMSIVAGRLPRKVEAA